jgi:V-type H+-transporting ATPase subunit d
MDRRALNITLNSIGTELSRDDRKKLYSNYGLLNPHGHNELSVAEDFDQIRAAMEKIPTYASIFSKVCKYCSMLGSTWPRSSWLC